MANRDLLIEIGTEELPPKALLPLSEAFRDEFAAQLQKAGLVHGEVEVFATPRRLALIVHALPEQQADRTVEKWGPAVQSAFAADGTPSKAAEGFARGCGVTVAALQQKSDGKVTKLLFVSTQAGDKTANLVPDMVRAALAALPIPKRMRWGSTRDEFVRPVHWVVLLFGSEVINATIMGVQTGAETRGHRFHHPNGIHLNSPEFYARLLRGQGKVIASFAERRDEVRKQVEAEGQKLGARAVIEDALLDEVTSLVEWPVALTGNFDKNFLDVPQEALISAMKGHQKCFHLLDANGNILPNFITLSNLVSKDPAQVIAGNEKVIRPRLADAAFFYAQDKKLKLADRIEKLKTVVFQQELGTVYDKSQRVKALALHIAELLGTDKHLAGRAAELGKCDLMTKMVYEFAELQGIMGYYYALNDGENKEVALALNEQYMPRFAGDELPTTATGRVLAMAERLDTIAGLFAIGQPPTGSKDPFALRRAALGVLRIIIEKQLPLDLDLCVDFATRPFLNLPKAHGVKQAVLDFVFERLRALYSDQGISADVFLAVDAVRPSSPLLFDARIKAVSHFVKLPAAQALAAANKRVSNILQKSDPASVNAMSTALLKEPAERALYNSLSELLTVTSPLLVSHRYTEALAAMASLQSPVDAFFNEVMVNVDDVALRNNRLGMLNQLRQLFLRVADISLLQNV
ncbi:MAG TPA: glycine--tRNA ligase subunit beta [Candidatus Acidoferrum sp.]|nr:glycine--tRNA ligase subunit beta [Candidatus Acidoferrum sp.]